MSRINVRVDEVLKDEAAILFNDLGIDMTTAITMFLKQSIVEQGLPFQPKRESLENGIARKEALSGKVETFDSVSSFMADLEKEIADDRRDMKEKSK